MTFPRFFWLVELFLLLVAIIVLGIAVYSPNTLDHRRYLDIGVLAIAFSIFVRRAQDKET